MRSALSTILFAAAVSLLAAACGDGDPGAETTPPTTSGTGATGGADTGGTGGANTGGATAGGADTGGADTGGASTGGAGGAGGGETGGGGAGGAPMSMNDDYMYPPGSIVAGKTLGEWGRAWWEWALSVPVDTNPMLGGPCDQDQPADVFFLAGNTGETETRTCAVPADRPLFFPILNVVCRQNPEASCNSTPMTVQECAKTFFDKYQVQSLALDIDGASMQDLSDYRAITGLFHDTQPDDPTQAVFGSCYGPIKENSCGIPVGTPRADAGDGFWVMVYPLASGEHTIHFAGSFKKYDGTLFALDVTYDLTVAP